MASIDDNIPAAVVEGCSVPTMLVTSSSQSTLLLKINSALICFRY
jgi:hypothetical protein